MEPVRIILLEDDPDFRESLIESLAIHGYPVIGVGTGLAFYQEIGRGTFDIAVIDLGLPDLDGYDVVEYLRRNSTAGVIVITCREDIADRIKGYTAGADLYLTKPINSQELAAAIGSIADRRRTTIGAGCAPMPKHDGWRLAKDSWLLSGPGCPGYRLSQREFALLMTLAEQPGQPISREVLLTRVYGRSDESAAHALEALISRFRSRFLGQHRHPLPVQTISGTGYRFAASLVIF